MNKKVANARTVEANGIKFKSVLEFMCYNMLIKNGFYPEYENKKFTVFNGFMQNENLHIYQPKNARNRSRELMQEYTRKILPITYTPDFYINLGSIDVFIETKGKANDTYPLKKKMFFNVLNNADKTIFFFEPHSREQLLQMIDILKEIS